MRTSVAGRLSVALATVKTIGAVIIHGQARSPQSADGSALNQARKPEEAGVIRRGEAAKAEATRLKWQT
jgi:hypothetical protein